MNPCPKRSIRPLDPLAVGSFAIKVYSIALLDEPFSSKFEQASRRVAIERLEAGPTSHRTHGVGFLGIHQGFNENQIFLDLWINQNELHHTVWISPKDNDTAITLPPADFNSVCIWDLAVQAFERKAWLECVLRNPSGPDLERYLSTLMNEDA